MVELLLAKGVQSLPLLEGIIEGIAKGNSLHQLLIFRKLMQNDCVVQSVSRPSEGEDGRSLNRTAARLQYVILPTAHSLLCVELLELIRMATRGWDTASYTHLH